MTLIVNLYGGPGTGKSTTAAGIFNRLKRDGVNCELVHEYAKILTWEGREKALSYQPYVMAKQMFSVWKLIDQVDVVITDSPILLGSVYKGIGWTPTYGKFLVETHKSWNTLDIYLARDREHHPYNPKGRNQTEQEALTKDREILDLLYQNLPFHVVPIGYYTELTIIEFIYGCLGTHKS